MIRYYFFILFFGSLAMYGQSTTTQASKQSLKLQAEILKIIKKNALYKDSLNWQKIEEESKMLQLSNNDSISEKLLFDFFKSKLREAGDKHSFFISKKAMTARSQKPVDVHPEAKYLGDNVGSIKVPRCLSFDAEKDIAFANTIRTQIKEIDSTNTITGWVVDLRNNTGGNMWPMLAGLNALMDDGTVGYFVFPTTNKKDPWKVENGKSGGKKRKINDYKIENRQVKIAVLIDGLTGSSGETTAISFLGLPNVKTFGQPSAGYTTSNQMFILSNEAHLYLAVGIASDRTGKVYPEKINPDVLITDNTNTTEDEVVEEAKKWIIQ
jgi:C-terminal processing protease CtpA/Prc